MFPSLIDIEEVLASNVTDDMPQLRISILRNIMLEPIEPYIRYLAFQEGFNAKVRFGEFDNVFQEAVGGSPLLTREGLDAVLVFTRLEGLSWDIARNFTGLSSSLVESEIRRLDSFFLSVIKGIRSQTDSMILWCGIEPPLFPSFGIFDNQTDAGQTGAIDRVNKTLRDRLAGVLNAYYINIGNCLSRVGAQSFYDSRYWHIGRAPYGREGLREITQEAFKYLRALKGKNKKCLVLDCDNTLWGGIVGEEGFSGIKLGKTYPGSAFYEFQQEIVSLSNRGIIIAICSKNNEDDVWEVFDKHPDMVLKREDIASWRINWQNKAANIREIAQELNISLESMVFVDDSKFEIELVRHELPQLSFLQLPKDSVVNYRNMLASCGLFDTLTLSYEDKQRSDMYHAEAFRRDIRAHATDMESYYRSLQMEVEVGFADEFTIPRIAQQTQKTNQFNLTTRRYNEADIAKLSLADDSDVLWMRLRDRFGDSGVVGSCVLKYVETRAYFDTFLISCRALGRGIERAFLISALQLARSRGCKSALGVYLKSKKNSQVGTFFLDNDFTEIESERTEDKRAFVCDLNEDILTMPDYFKSVKSNLR